MARYVDSAPVKMPIDFVFDEQEGVDADIGLFFDYMKQSLPKGAQRLINGRPVYKNDKLVLPLQAADMLAWHLRREHEVCTPPERLPMADLLCNADGHLSSQIEEPMMKTWAIHHQQQPGIAGLQSKSQWRTFRAEIARLNALGYIPPQGTKWRNALHGIRERGAKILSRLGVTKN